MHDFFIALLNGSISIDYMTVVLNLLLTCKLRDEKNEKLMPQDEHPLNSVYIAMEKKKKFNYFVYIHEIKSSRAFW